MVIPATQLDWGMRFAERYVYLRHVHGIGWHVWDDTRWRRDDDGETTRVYASMVKQTWADIPSIPGADERKKAVQALIAAERRPFAEGALWFAAAQPEMALAASRLDAQRMLLNCANGTLDLDTMTLLPHNPGHNITRICRGQWLPGLGDTKWAAFTAQILPDPAIRGFVQRLTGSALHGRVREHILPIFTGTGSNGKSTFTETISYALGDYALQADPTLLMASSHDPHPTGQAALQGRRLVTCSETSRGRHLDAATAKQLTGGDTITARYMRQDFFSFEPSHTIVMITNHKPVVDGSDDALWRRLIVVPFDQVFGNDKADPGLKEVLQSEPDAVLSWMIDGWIAYQEHGLNVPAAVSTATATYQADSDAVGRFVDERFYPTQFGKIASAAVYAEWQKWCVTNGEEPITQKAFTEQLLRRGYEKSKSHGRIMWEGFTLLTSDNAEPGENGGGSGGFSV